MLILHYCWEGTPAESFSLGRIERCCYRTRLQAPVEHSIWDSNAEAFTRSMILQTWDQHESECYPNFPKCNHGSCALLIGFPCLTVLALWRFFPSGKLFKCSLSTTAPFYLTVFSIMNNFLLQFSLSMKPGPLRHSAFAVHPLQTIGSCFSTSVCKRGT
jgi:hypothetical protein